MTSVPEISISQTEIAEKFHFWRFQLNFWVSKNEKKFIITYSSFIGLHELEYFSIGDGDKKSIFVCDHFRVDFSIVVPSYYVSID